MIYFGAADDRCVICSQRTRYGLEHMARNKVQLHFALGGGGEGVCGGPERVHFE